MTADPIDRYLRQPDPPPADLADLLAVTSTVPMRLHTFERVSWVRKVDGSFREHAEALIMRMIDPALRARKAGENRDG